VLNFMGASNLLEIAALDRTSTPASDYVVVLRGLGRDVPGRAFHRLIRDHPHG
jgi:hypothetical protein